MQTRIDHLVIAAESLERGVEYLKTVLGVEIPYGGEHLKMGTHNHLMKLADGIFLEIIAVNHDMEAPERPRWFGFDDPFVSSKINEKPGLLTWVVNTENIHELVKKASFSTGIPSLIERGDLNWYFGLPEDGRLLGSGMLPYCIQWNTDKHPSEKMADLKCSLKKLEIYHPCPGWIESSLKSIGAYNLVKITGLDKNEKPYMEVTIDSPLGTKILRSY